ncbi:MAG: N-succinylarginine dihydrolase [Phycisphaerales bacterium]|nr:N-succinylarginine dihydrolase [Phycisphaerales bacterium]
MPGSTQSSASSPLVEANFDGLVGPTHNYAGLSYGNVASTTNTGTTSRPRAAALQGIAKMRRVMALGVPQGVLPPHERPHLPTLRALGFAGGDAALLEAARTADPNGVLLAQVSSASAMWTANAATVAPSIDTADYRTHLLTANLVSMFHRSIEHPTTMRVLSAIFANTARFTVHPALPSSPALGDEGAANHTRLFDDTSTGGQDSPGLHIFVYGASNADKSAPRPKKFPARQTLEASRAAARLLTLDPKRTLFVQQNPDAVDAGVFHNDVIAVGSGRVLLYHQHAFADERATLDAIAALLPSLVPVRISADEVPLAEVVTSYLFNSQLLALNPDRYTLVAPIEAEQSPRVKAAIDRLLADTANPIREVVYLDVRESMRNGGGPACLRLRVPLTEGDLKAVNPACIMDERKLNALEAWVTAHYPEELTPADLADPTLLRESRDALDALTRLLELGNVYVFQGGK